MKEYILPREMNRILIVFELVDKLKDASISSQSAGYNLFFHCRSRILRDKETKEVATIGKLHVGMVNAV